MGKYRVYNMHRDGLTHKEVFKGDLITIKAGDYVLMDYEDAVQFKGQFFPIKTDAMGQQTPESYKMIKIESHTEEPALSSKQEVKVFVSPIDGKKFNTESELNAYIEANFGDAPRVIDPELDKDIAEKKKTKKA